MILKNGSKGDDVIRLQRKLIGLGYSVKDDGVFGDNTEKAVKAVQLRFNLKDDGIVGNNTWAVLDTPTTTRPALTDKDYQWAADYLQVDLPAVKAVKEVEAPAGGFLPDGRVTILYERHVMFKRLRVNGINPEPFAAANPSIVNKSTGGYLGKSAEYTRLEQAEKIDEVSALESCSWGAYQIMGYHWKLLGFGSVHDFLAKMKESERGQLECFVKFIKADAALLKNLRAKDWAKFAAGYNGPNYRQNNYDVKLASAYTKFGGK
ncbi:endolysin [Pseudomonas phage 201phi2-1]|uniref:Virion structural protein n=1 Tax=Pseudomonas phage 201phi2-1 TaxID=198110 RepID=B3FJ91_BP201|nr:endolysin [Pseudomonas phage 201phi2-1]ABY63058.1 virion structural protein [Pseudomonas phage 201phi2-1]